jgi:hypothetical protein
VSRHHRNRPEGRHQAQVSEGFKMLEEAGLKDYAFENVVLRHPESFSAEISLRLFSAVPDYASVPAPYS